MDNWIDNIMQIMPAPGISAVYTDEIGRLEWYPAAGTALYRLEGGGTELQLFLFDVDGVATTPEGDINFIGWFSGNNRPTDEQIAATVTRLNKKNT